MASKVRVGFVGVGGHGVSHVQAVAGLKGEAEIIAVCDIKPGLAAKRTDEFGGTPYLSSDEMFDAEKLDAVFISLPPTEHGVEFTAIEHGVPFLVEKPVNLSVEQADAIAKAADEKGVMACAGYMNRYRRGINEARRMFADDPPVLTVGGWINGAPGIATEGLGVWWPVKEKSGGQFVEQVTHTADLVRFLCGEPTEVSALAAQGFVEGHPTYNLDDALAVTVKFENGGVANLYSCCASGAAGVIDLRVYAAKSAASFTGWEHSVTLQTAGKKPITIAGEDEIFTLQDRTFLGAVRTGDPTGAMSTYADAVKTLKFTMAANRAAETGEAVKLT